LRGVAGVAFVSSLSLSLYLLLVFIHSRFGSLLLLLLFISFPFSPPSLSIDLPPSSSFGACASLFHLFHVSIALRFWIHHSAVHLLPLYLLLVLLLVLLVLVLVLVLCVLHA